MAKHAQRYNLFMSTAHQWNIQQYQRLAARAQPQPSSSSNSDVELAKKSAKEHSKGVIVGPYTSVPSLTKALVRLCPEQPQSAIQPRPMNRFAIVKKGAVRAIDDGRSNGSKRSYMHV